MPFNHACTAAAGTQPVTPVDELVELILAASDVLIAVAARSLTAAGDEVTPPQYRALVVLATSGPKSTLDLAAALAVSPFTAARLRDRLIGKGLVRRHRRLGDRRRPWIALTPAGRELVAAVSARHHAELAQLLAALSAQDRQQVIAAFSAFTAAADRNPLPGAAPGWAAL